MVLARSFSQAFLSAASAAFLSVAASSTSNTLPWRTLATPSMPRLISAPLIALPCGSSTPVFNVTVTRAFIRSIRNGDGGARPPPKPYPQPPSLHEHRSAPLRRLALGHDAEPAGDLGIGLDQAAKIA